MTTRNEGIHQLDLVGQQSVDHERRVDIGRLKRERLARLQAEINRADLGAALLYDPINIRYATGTRDASSDYGLRLYHRYALVPRTGRVILFGSFNDAVAGEVAIDARDAHTWDFFVCGRNVEEAARRWATNLRATLDELGLTRERIGIDRLDFTAFEALRESARHQDAG